MDLQVPRNGYVIIRTKLDNPGHWLVHCHIEVHVKQGMSLVVKIGETGDWNTGPESLDVECSEQKPRSLEGSVTILTNSSNILLSHRRGQNQPESSVSGHPQSQEVYQER